MFTKMNIKIEIKNEFLKQMRFIEDVNSGKCKLESTVQLKDGGIVGIGTNGKDEGYVVEFIDGKWTLPRGPVSGADFHEGKPIKIDLSDNM